MVLSISLALACIAAAWLAQTILRGLTGPLRKVPGPWYARFTSIPLKVATLRGRQTHFIDALHASHGGAVRVAPNELSFRDAGAFRDIHRPGNGFRKAPWYRHFSRDRDAEENRSLLTICDPKVHAARRKLLARAFSKSEFRKTWEAEVRRKVLFAMRRMGEDGDDAGEGGAVDVYKWWHFLTADIISRVAFGESFGMLESGKKDAFIQALERLGKVNSYILELPLLRLYNLLPASALRTMLGSNDAITRWARLAVANSKETASPSGTRNIFAGLVAEAEKQDYPLTDLRLVKDARLLIIAGAGTTADTLTYLVWAVASRPRLRAALVEELKGLGELGGEGWTDERLEALPLLNAVAHETLRLYNPAPGMMPRCPPPGGATVAGYFVPEDVVVGTQSWSLHRNPEVWGPDAEEFDISRWLPDGAGRELSEAAKASFHPFGGGARTCLGIHLAWMELRYGAAAFFSAFPKARVAPSTTADSMEPVTYFTMHPKAGECRILLS